MCAVYSTARAPRAGSAATTILLSSRVPPRAGVPANRPTRCHAITPAGVLRGGKTRPPGSLRLRGPTQPNPTSLLLCRRDGRRRRFMATALRTCSDSPCQRASAGALAAPALASAADGSSRWRRLLPASVEQASRGALRPRTDWGGATSRTGPGLPAPSDG
eukprot:scaffold4825_cov347-Prasinococcus_capsulatus_cf.AAC.1